VCPSCGVQFTVVARPLFSNERGGSSTGKTGWRSKAFKRPKPVLPVDPEERAQEVAQDATEETPSAVAEDDLVLEQEPDDADVTDLVDHDVKEAKEG
jgi:hypothetical protein